MVTGITLLIVLIIQLSLTLQTLCVHVLNAYSANVIRHLSKQAHSFKNIAYSSNLNHRWLVYAKHLSLFHILLNDIIHYTSNIHKIAIHSVANVITSYENCPPSLFL